MLSTYSMYFTSQSTGYVVQSKFLKQTMINCFLVQTNTLFLAGSHLILERDSDLKKLTLTITVVSSLFIICSKILVN